MKDNKFFNEDNDFLLTDQESKKAWKMATTALLYLLLIIVVIVTGAHGIMVVMHSTSDAYSVGGGLTAAFLNIVRISFPVTVELAAVVAALGFISSSWRKGQKWVAGGIEVTWLIFAAANMIVMFRIERGIPLEAWQENWISYGLPLSALIAGSLTYLLKRADPDHKRADEAASAAEKKTMLIFSAQRDVALSDESRAIEKQRAWVDYVRALKTRGYTDTQIRFMMQGVPELSLDADGNGELDLLEEGDAAAIPGRYSKEPKRRGLGDMVTTVLERFGGNGDMVTTVLERFGGNGEQAPAAAAQTRPAAVTIEPEREPKTQNSRSATGNGSDFPLR